MDERQDGSPGRVISFPALADPQPASASQPQLKRKAKTKAMKLESPAVPHDRLVLGPLVFTCPFCGNQMVISGLGAIVRQVDMYCSQVGCGRLARVKNNAFAALPGTP